MSFSDLKKQSKLGSLTSKLVREVEKMNTTSGGDERLWKPEVDKSGNGYAVIRFLPAPEGEDIPWVKMYSHAFQGPGGWYMENSLTTLGSKDPVSEHNSQLWNSGSDANKEIARKQKRKLSYYANLYIVKDPANPSNEGGVFLYKFGKKIFDKIMDVMQPQFADETPINPYDFWEGAEFKIKIRKVEGWVNYDKSEFSKASALFEGDETRLQETYDQLHALSEFTDPANYKSYDELKAKFNRVLGVDAGATMEAPVMETAEPAAQPASDDAMSFGDSADDGKEEDTLSYFAKLAQE